ncbi:MULTISPECIES: hypothetical protein [Ectopseudomonas]|jgi:hypothetical protein|uniref:Uncharacterized protein n=2 Tax=Ectopseudomonas TaxID=3236654 RepID=A0A1G6Q198_9GAMM|nr:MULTISPECIES: hypothetical protein [Pseudomonas]ALN21816.1 hypothetical protein DW68_024365 [Pseudomonas mendocina S5.2]KER98129.1 hypothetical protein HN51_25355 [Pseudomonas mendocina]MBP3062013.1 hypothetical protein [Pseudomonas chengduensis]NNB75307.1 hypothetical protein [Pseudomonas chengduensis]OEO24453.1 hypothetical protein AX279_17440 [Pseudomonas sp. J237]
MSEILHFPSMPRLHNNKVQQNQAERKKLADWLRSLAQHIEANEIEREPLAAMVVLSSAAGDEVLSVGYEGNDAVCRRQAGSAAHRHTNLGGYSRRGGNFYDRIK